MLPGEIHRLSGAQAFHDLHYLFQAACPARWWDAGVLPLMDLVIVESPPNPRGDDQASFGDQVDGGAGLGQQHGMAQRRQQHGRAQPYTAGPSSHGRQGRQRLHPGFGCQTVPHPNRIQAGFFRPLCHVQHQPGVPRHGFRQQQATGWQEDAQFYA